MSYYPSAADVGTAYREYVVALQLNIWTSSIATAAVWDEISKKWTVTVSANGVVQTILARHVVFAIGASGRDPKVLELPGRGDFKGTILHSSEYWSAETHSGKRAVVIGAAVSGHEIAKDLAGSGLFEVTMIQRRPTVYVLTDWVHLAFDHKYNDHASIGEADRITYGQAFAVSRVQQIAAFKALRAQRKEWFEALDRAGLKTHEVTDFVHSLYEVSIWFAAQSRVDADA